jgi:alpha-N-arabinofuranosidase
MANLAQTVNVLQAVILTEGDKMVLTPTYHVFDLFKHHHDATRVHSYVQTQTIGTEAFPLPHLNASASLDENGVLTATLVNPSASAALPVEVLLTGMEAKHVAARMLSGNIQDLNDFGAPDKVKIVGFNGITLTPGTLSLTLPPCTVIEIRVTP